MKEYEPTKLTLKHCDVEISAELSWDSNIDDLMQVFVGELRAVGFGEWIVNSIKEWCEDQLPAEEAKEE